MNPFLEARTGLWLLDPWLLLLALLVPLALLLRGRSGAPAVHFAPAGLLGALPRAWRVRLVPLPAALQAAGLLLAVFALARPVARHPLPLTSEGIDILLCLDLSSSMQARDLDPARTRLDVARDAARRFIEGRPHDRIGLIGFARFPDLLCPPTLDQRALLEILGRVERVEPEGPEDLTGIGAAVARAAQILARGEADSRVLIVLTDGEENVATADTPEEIGPVRAARICEALGIKVYTIAAGIGNQGLDGQWIPIDSAQIRSLAEISGGRFFEARDAGAMAGVYASIDALERAEQEQPRYAIEERFLPFLGASLVLLALGALVQAAVLRVAP